MLYFKNRALARMFAKKNSYYVVVDCKDNLSARGHRWAVKVLK